MFNYTFKTKVYLEFCVCIIINYTSFLIIPKKKVYLALLFDWAHCFRNEPLLAGFAAMDKVTKTVSTQIATPRKSTTSSNSNSSVPIQIKPKSQFGIVPRDTENSEFLDLVDFGGVAISKETVIGPRHHSN